MTKTCAGCGADKPPDDFYKSKGRCKACLRAYARQHSRRRYGAMTDGERRTYNRMRWQRWGRPRHLRNRTPQQELRAEVRQLSRDIDRMLLPPPSSRGKHKN